MTYEIFLFIRILMGDASNTGLFDVVTHHVYNSKNKRVVSYSKHSLIELIKDAMKIYM